MVRWVFTMVLALATGPVFATDGPPLEFFAGKYEMLGRAPGSGGLPIQDWVTITVEGDRLLISACRTGTGDLKAGANRDEHEAQFSGMLGPWPVACDYQVDRGNYGRITCYIGTKSAHDVPGLVTLWPAHWDQPEHAAGCE